MIVISASFLGEPNSIFEKYFRRLKSIVGDLLVDSGLRHPGQFLGWQRSRAEYQQIMRDSGFISVEDGFVSETNPPAYFIIGS